jgi:hypothetical protein
VKCANASLLIPGQTLRRARELDFFPQELALHTHKDAVAFLLAECDFRKKIERLRKHKNDKCITNIK